MATRIENERLAVVETKMTIVQEKLKSVEEKVDNLPDELIKRLDDKYSQREKTDKRLAAIEDVISPLVNIRKKLWTWLLGAVIGLGAIEAIAYYMIIKYLK